LLLILGLTGFGAGLLMCCGLAATGLMLTRTTVQRQAKNAMRIVTTGQPRWVEDWAVIEMLTPVYTSALDAIAANARVTEQLGSDIEATDDTGQLFRRKAKGSIRAEETLEFDIKGSQGRATVSVVANSMVGNPQGRRHGLRAESITVTLSDGTAIKVPPPAEPKDQ